MQTKEIKDELIEEDKQYTCVQNQNKQRKNHKANKEKTLQ